MLLLLSSIVQWMCICIVCKCFIRRLGFMQTLLSFHRASFNSREKIANIQNKTEKKKNSHTHTHKHAQHHQIRSIVTWMPHLSQHTWNRDIPYYVICIHILYYIILRDILFVFTISMTRFFISFASSYTVWQRVLVTEKELENKR